MQLVALWAATVSLDWGLSAPGRVGNRTGLNSLKVNTAGSGANTAARVEPSGEFYFKCVLKWVNAAVQMVFVQLKRETRIQGEGGALFFLFNKENRYKNVSFLNILRSHFIYEAEQA